MPLSTRMYVSLRKANLNDYEEVNEIWLESSLRAYDFLPSKYWWQRQHALLRLYRERAEVWLAERRGQICGFLALVKERLVALFVRPELQGRGISSQLIEHAKCLRSHLELHIYADNREAIEFYQLHQFIPKRRWIERYSGYPLLSLCYWHTD